MIDGTTPAEPTQGLMPRSNSDVHLHRDAKPELKFVQLAVIQESGRLVALRDDGQIFTCSRDRLKWEKYPPCPQD